MPRIATPTHKYPAGSNTSSTLWKATRPVLYRDRRTGASGAGEAACCSAPNPWLKTCRGIWMFSSSRSAGDVERSQAQGAGTGYRDRLDPAAGCADTPPSQLTQCNLSKSSPLLSACSAPGTWLRNGHLLPPLILSIS